MQKKLICTLKLLTCIIYVQVLLSGAFQFSSLIEKCYFMTFNNMVVSFPSLCKDGHMCDHGIGDLSW